MKKTIRTILCVATFAVLAVSCQKEMEINEVESNTKETIEISVNGLMGEYTQVDATKSSLVNTVRVSWENGDIVYVYDGTQCLGSLVASIDGTEDRYAILSTDKNHTVTAPTAGTKLTLVHSPLLTEAPAVSDGAISISLAEQNGTKAPFVAYATLDYNNEESINNAIVPFKFATSVIKVNCSGLKAGTAITSATLSNVNTVCNLTLFGDKAPVVAGGTNGIITRTGDSYFAASKVNTEGEAVFQIAVPALETASDARVLTVEQGSDKVKDKKFTTNSLTPATSVNTVCQFVRPPVGALPGLFTIGNNRQVYFSQGNLFSDLKNFFFEENQYDFSSYWNESHISHFYWSEDYTKARAQDYNDPAASVCDIFFANASDFVVWRLQWLPQVGIVSDMLTGWYTLSKQEWLTLFEKTDRMVYGKPCYSNALNGVSIENKTYKGVFVYPDDYNGDIVSDDSMTWNDINAEGIVFLPATGSRNGSSVSDVGSVCQYWSSSPDSQFSLLSSYVYFDSDYGTILSNRGVGYAVRLVKELK